ncbi:hypothetical protein BKA69DRAFT_735726 [Paraphysoderma sedebokerense]|nr:hypothetical protein BKA69DRAFT_735726 [Paraphysoderma sedebokerense]
MTTSTAYIEEEELFENINRDRLSFQIDVHDFSLLNKKKKPVNFTDIFEETTGPFYFKAKIEYHELRKKAPKLAAKYSTDIHITGATNTWSLTFFPNAYEVLYWIDGQKAWYLIRSAHRDYEELFEEAEERSKYAAYIINYPDLEIGERSPTLMRILADMSVRYRSSVDALQAYIMKYREFYALNLVNLRCSSRNISVEQAKAELRRDCRCYFELETGNMAVEDYLHPTNTNLTSKNLNGPTAIMWDPSRWNDEILTCPCDDCDTLFDGRDAPLDQQFEEHLLHDHNFRLSDEPTDWTESKIRDMIERFALECPAVRDEEKLFSEAYGAYQRKLEFLKGQADRHLPLRSHMKVRYKQEKQTLS